MISVDASDVLWDQFRLRNGAGDEVLLTGDKPGEANVDSVLTVRAGAEYLFLFRHFLLAVRGGGLYDPEPSRGAPEAVFGVTGGLGVSFTAFSIDVAYQYRFGNDLSGVSVLDQVFKIPDGKQDLRQQSVYLSMVVYY